MIQAVTAVNARGEALRLMLRDPFSTGIHIADIDGLGPGKAVFGTTDLYGKEGSSFNSARLPSRLITFELELIGPKDIETSRRQTYQYFPIKEEVTLIFETDSLEAYIVGRVENNEPSIFEEREKIVIAVMCFDYFFRKVLDGGEGKINFTSVDGGLEFPLSNPSGLDEIEFGDIQRSNIAEIFYEGTDATGVEIRLDAAFGPVVNPTVSNLTNGTSATIETANLPAGAFLVGDRLVLSSATGSKKLIHVKKDGSVEERKAFRALKRGSTWIRLEPGLNTIEYNADSGVDNIQLNIGYEVRMSGI